MMRSISTHYIIWRLQKTKELEKYSELLETGTATEYVDIKESDGLISMAYLYQDKELIERHGIGVIIGK